MAWSVPHLVTAAMGLAYVAPPKVWRHSRVSRFHTFTMPCVCVCVIGGADQEDGLPSAMDKVVETRASKGNWASLNANLDHIRSRAFEPIYMLGWPIELSL